MTFTSKAPVAAAGFAASSVDVSWINDWDVMSASVSVDVEHPRIGSLKVSGFF